MRLTFVLIFLSIIESAFNQLAGQSEYTGASTYSFQTPVDSALSSRVINTFSENGNLLSSITYDWNSSKKIWQGYTKEEYSWDAQGNKTMVISSYWNYDLNCWANSRKIEYTWDAKKIVSNTVYTWNNIQNDWQSYTKYVYTYNSQGNILLYISYDWYSGSSGWMQSIKTEYSYDNEGNNTLTTSNIWNGGAEYYVKTENAYDDAGRKTLETVSYRPPDSDIWILFSTTEKSYDGDGNLLSEIRFESASGFLSGSGTYKNEYSYSPGANLISTLIYSWDGNINDWVLVRKEENSYDDSGNIILAETSDWKSAANEWIVISRKEYEFDINGNEILSINYLWNSEPHEMIFSARFATKYDPNGNITSKAYYDQLPGSSDWRIRNKTFYAYKQSLIINNGQVIRVFPNPFRDMVYVEIPGDTELYSVELFDTGGNKIISSRARIIDLSFLSGGMYFLRIIDGNGNKTKTLKLIKD